MMRATCHGADFGQGPGRALAGAPSRLVRARHAALGAEFLTPLLALFLVLMPAMNAGAHGRQRSAGGKPSFDAFAARDRAFAAPGADARSAAATATPQASPPQPDTRDTSGAQALLAEAKRLFDALDYEQALVRLDALVTQLQARRAEPAAPALSSPAVSSSAPASTAPPDAAGAAAAALARTLVEALELRARAHFGVGHPEQAREDFRALLALRADYAPGETVSPRVVSFFKEVRAELIGQVRLTIEPADAIARIDGIRVGPFGQPLDIVSGPHVLGIVRTGYRPETRDFLVDPGQLVELTVSMARSSAILAVTTRPAGVEVKVDGVSRGITAPAAPASSSGSGPPPAGQPAAATATLPTDTADSAPLLVADLGTGSHRVELARPCHEPAVETVVIDQLGDYRVGPVVLTPAVGVIRVGSGLAADIYFDGERRGGAPQTIARVCAGEHVLEARTASGRDLRRLTVKAGEQMEVTLTPRPALALLGNAGLLSGAPEDIRARVERALAPAARVFVLSPSLAEVRRIESAERAPAGWLAVGPGGKPGVGGEWASAAAAAGRRELSARLAKALGVQGVVAISRAPERPGMVWLTILAAGASEPDVIPLEIERPAPALRTLDDAPLSSSVLLRRTLDLSLVDVLDRPGPVVLTVGAGGASGAGTAAAGASGTTTAAGPAGSLAPGDALVALNGQAVASVRDVRRVLDAMGPASTVALTAQSRSGESRTVHLPLLVHPRLLSGPTASASVSSSPGAPSLGAAAAPAGASSGPSSSGGGAATTPTAPALGGPSNVLLLDLRARLSEAAGLEGAALRLNLAAALTRVGDAASALALLDELSTAGLTMAAAAAQAQRAVALEALGRAADARRAWQSTLDASPATVSSLDETPALREIAARRLRGTASAATAPP